MSVISTAKGAKIQYNGKTMKVVSAASFDSLTLQDEVGEYFHATFADLEAEAQPSAVLATPIDPIRQSKVPAYVDALGSLLGDGKTTRSMVEVAAAKLGISRSSAYEALKRFKLSGSTADLPPPTRPGGRGKSRINPQAEKIIMATLDEVMLNRRNYQPRRFYREANKRLAKAGYEVSQFTLRERLAKVPDYKWQKSRKGYNEAQRTHTPLKGNYPEVAKPLEAVQVDHWKADIEVLSEDRLTSVGRVWITLAIDIYSRMVFGMHVGFDAPSTMTLGLAMINGMLRKDAIAERYGFTWDNPINGPLERLEADNAKEFRGASAQKSAEHFGIRLKWRPLGAPQYGGHIERLNGTLATKFKELPGATGSTHKERANFRPEMTAAFTLEDLTRHAWLLVDEYHNEIHTGIGMTPLEKYKGFFFGPEGPRRRLPPVYVDNLDFRLQWYPLEYRSLQRYGIRLDYMDYYSEAIEHLVKNRRQHGPIMIRRNPFDVREIYFFHPTRQEWITLPTRHIGFPVASIYELKQARRQALDRKRKPTPEVLAKIIDEQHAHIEAAKKKTKTAQRAAAQKSHHDRIREETRPTRPSSPPPRPDTPARSRQPDMPTEQSIASILAGISDEDIEENFA